MNKEKKIVILLIVICVIEFIIIIGGNIFCNKLLDTVETVEEKTYNTITNSIEVVDFLNEEEIVLRVNGSIRIYDIY